MGSDEGQDDESPVHRVWVDAFDLAVYPVTQAQYAQFLGRRATRFPGNGRRRPAKQTCRSSA